QLVEQYAREQGLWHDPEHVPDFTRIVDLDLSSVEPSIAGPRRPQDRIALGDAPRTVLGILAGEGKKPPYEAGGGEDAAADSFPAHAAAAAGAASAHDPAPRP